MPKRSNDFQRLIYLIRLNLANGATVTESKMMRDRLTKSYREVDVVIKGKVGSQPVVVCVECRDHKRVADIGWIDAMKAKHDRLDTNVLLLASSAGFTKEATAVAAKYGIELFTLESLDTVDLPSLIGPDGSLWHKTYELSASKVSVRVAKGVGLEVETIASTPDNLIYLEDGSELCQAKDLVDKMLNSEGVRDYLAREGREEHLFFEFRWEPPSDQLGKPLYMTKLEPRAFRPIECIRVVGRIKIQVAQFGMKHGRLGSIRVAWGKAKIAGRDAMAVATQTPSGETKLSINVQGSV
ncbi:MAG: hypothetical protein ABI135_07480 [Rhodoferax sp.]